VEVKVKFFLSVYESILGIEVYLHTFLNSAIDEMSGHLDASVILSLKESPNVY
jgi:hypothetical protein